MARVEAPSVNVRSKILLAAAELFLERGYSASTIRDIAEVAGVNRGSVAFAFKHKEAIMCELVGNVLEGQFQKTAELIKGRTDDKVLFYAFETTLQLYMAESSEHIRELYSVAYSMSESSQIIYRKITNKLQCIFAETLPHLKPMDFYEREIASAGIMRNFMTVPCDIYFDMNRKVKAFLKTTFLVYEVSEEKIKEAIDFVMQYDFRAIAKETIDGMLNQLKNNIG